MSGRKRIKVTARNRRAKSQQASSSRTTTKRDGIRVGNLPPELWEQIFKKVESPKDLLSCWYTTPSWKGALRSTDLCFKMTLPFLLPYLNRSDLIAASAVTKSWNATVNVCLQTAVDFGSDCWENRQQKVVLYLNSGSMPDFITAFSLSTTDNLQQKIPATNPVAFQHVSVMLWLNPRIIRWGEQVATPNEQQQIRARDPFPFDEKNLLLCLDHFGHLVQHFDVSILSFSGTTTTCLDQLTMTRNCLKRMPNLRVLDIKAGTSSKFVTSYDDYRTIKWPKLEHLKMLKFGESTGKEFACVANAYASQITHLQFGFHFVKPYLPNPGSFLCLQKVVYFFNDTQSGFNFEEFLQLSQCQLKHLRVVFTDAPDEENYEDLAIGINAASRTLETLVFRPDRLCAGLTGFQSDIKIFHHMRLAGLKELKVTNFGYPSVQFLQSVCPALRKLTVIAPKTEVWEIKKPGASMYSDLYSQHQFWNQLTGIQRVDVAHDGESSDNEINTRKIYTRERYEAMLLYYSN